MEALASEAKLLEAVRAGNVEHVQELLKSHPDAVHAADPHGWCPLPLTTQYSIILLLNYYNLIRFNIYHERKNIKNLVKINK
jgi:hypothetical protein